MPANLQTAEKLSLSSIHSVDAHRLSLKAARRALVFILVVATLI
jgi:hypothetical protein